MRTPRSTSRALGALLAFGCATAFAEPPKVDIPFHHFELENGLVVLLHEDHTLPQVTVNITYRVGSKDEVKGRTGFAHLFEHLMFMGTERAPRGAFDQYMEAEGAWNNAWTSEDRTDYYELGPSHTLPLFLWLEADRMQSLGRLIDQAKLDLQRDVVRNERRQTSENTPYGIVELKLPETLYPEGHPYHHPVIGSHEDLQAASVADVRAFFDKYYVPNNASLVIAGDFDSQAAEKLVRSYFGGIPRAADPHAADAPPPALSVAATRDTITLTDRVDQPRIHFVWQSPAHFGKEDAELDLLGAILSNGKASRLHATLVYEKQLAQDVSAMQYSGVLGSRFVVYATAREGITAEVLQRGLEDTLAAVLKDGVTTDEVERARNAVQMNFVSGLQSVMARASTLNAYQAELGRADFVADDLARYTRATAESVTGAARQWLDPTRRATLRVLPAPAATPASAPGQAPAQKGQP